MVIVSIKTLTTKTCMIVHIHAYRDADNHSRSTNLILTGLSGTANNFWYISNGSW